MPISASQASAKSNTHLSAFVQGSGFAGAGLICGGLLTLLTGVMFARWLGPESYGTYSVAFVTIMLLGGLGAAGLDVAVARFAAFYRGTGEQPLIRSVIRFGITWSLCLSVCLAALTYLFMHSSNMVPWKIRPLRPFTAYITLAVPCLAVLLVLQQGILALGGIRTRIVIEKVAQPLFRLVLPFGIFLITRNGLLSATSAILASTALAFLIAGFALKRFMLGLPLRQKAGEKEVKQWSGYALPFALQSIQYFVSAGMGIDIFLVGLLASLSASGIYAAAFRFTPLLTTVRVAMEYVFAPKASTLFGQSDFASIDVLYKASSNMGIAFSLPFGLFLALFSRPLMIAFFGQPYTEGATVLAILVIGFVADSATGCNTTLLMMVGKAWYVLINGLLGGVVTVVLCFLLIPRYGIMGAAFAVSFARVCVNVLATAELWVLQRFQPFTSATWKLLLAGLTSGILVALCKTHIPILSQANIVTLALICGFVVLTYGAGLHLTGMRWPRSV
jgi:O-antigen/teichoic acid export membrane protein